MRLRIQESGLARARAWSVLCGIFIAACAGDTSQVSDAPPDVPLWTAETAWRLAPDPIVVIGPDSARDRSPGVPFDAHTAFRHSSGRYVVGDGFTNGRQALLVYDSTGRFLQQLGRQGEGPAEFKRHYGWAGVVGGDSIAGYDDGLKRIQVWSADGTFGRSIPLNLGVGNFVFIMGGTHLVTGSFDEEEMRRSRTYSRHYDLHALDGRLIRRLFSKQETQSRRNAQHAPEFAAWTVRAGSGHHFYVGDWREFRVSVYDTLGDMVRMLTRNIPRREFPSSEKEEVIRTHLRNLGLGPEGAGKDMMSDLEKDVRRYARFPEFVPAFQTVIEDADGNAWVQHYYFVYGPAGLHPTTPRPTIWSVFDPAGRFLGEVETPPRLLVRSITTDQVIGFWTDNDDARHVHVYRLIKPDRKA